MDSSGRNEDDVEDCEENSLSVNHLNQVYSYSSSPLEDPCSFFPPVIMRTHCRNVDIGECQYVMCVGVWLENAVRWFRKLREEFEY